MIPPGGMQTEPKEMSIINFLSQELQIAVDSIKSAYPNNDKGLEAVTEYLNSLAEAGKIPWLKDFKDKEVYLKRPCGVADDAIDTISRLVKVVISYWQPAQLETNTDECSHPHPSLKPVLLTYKLIVFCLLINTR